MADKFDELRRYEDEIGFWDDFDNLPDDKLAALAERPSPFEEIECAHDNYDTTYEDENLWQGVCTDCGAELEDEIQEERGEQ